MGFALERKDLPELAVGAAFLGTGIDAGFTPAEEITA